MSQIYKSFSSGPIPPSVDQKLIADSADSTITAIAQPNPTTITATSNTFQINGDNGIETYALTNVALPTNILQVAFSRGFVTTTDATPTTARSFSTLNNSSFVMQAIVSGYCTGGIAGTPGSTCGGYMVGMFKNVGGVLSIVTIFTKTFNYDGSLSGTNFAFAVSGTNLLIQVTGLANQNINWGCCTPGIVTSADV